MPTNAKGGTCVGRPSREIELCLRCKLLVLPGEQAALTIDRSKGSDILGDLERPAIAAAFIPNGEVPNVDEGVPDRQPELGDAFLQCPGRVEYPTRFGDWQCSTLRAG